MPKKKYARPNKDISIMSREECLGGKPTAWHTISISGLVRNISPELFRFQHLTCLFLNDNRLDHISPHVSQLQHLVCLDLSSNQLSSLPSEIGDLTELRELLLFNNQLTSLPFELGRLFQLQNLDIKGNPLSQDYMHFSQGVNGTNDLLSFLLDNMPYTSTQLPHREWVKNEEVEPDQTHPAALFTVMCYNVLCDKYCTRQQYGYCPTWALSWDYRKKGIMDHILEFQADIISLQEVETDQFYSFFRPELTRHGYNGIFLPKSRARTMAAQDRKKVDGCAIFYKKDKFHLVDHKPVEFNQLAMANADGNDDMLNRVMTKDNIGLIALLQTKPPVFDNAGYPHAGPHTQQFLLVATAHIHWDPEYSDVKMVQTMMLMSEMLSFVEKITREQTLPFPGPYNCNSVPLVLCGDLNSLPDSGVIEFLTQGRVATNHEDFKDNVYDQVLKKLCNGDKINIYHDFHLKRAYNDVMPVTNYTYDFKGIIDYIYFTKGRLRVLQQLGPYDEAWFRLNKVLGCPHPHIPSDHFSLVVLFEMPILPPMPNRHLPPPGSKPR